MVNVGKKQMKSELTQVFQNDRFGNVRVVLIGAAKEPHFVGRDVAEILQYNEPHKAVSRHVDEDDRIKHPITDGLGRMQESWLINESGLYSLVLGSKLPSAKEFKQWVTKSVLPSIRQTGQYSIYNDMSPELKAIIMHDKKLQVVESRVDNLENTMTIDYGQQLELKDLGAKIVISKLGGKDSPAYKRIGKKAFEEIWRYYKRVMQLNIYRNTPVAELNKAREVLEHWEPTEELELMIRGANTSYKGNGG